MTLETIAYFTVALSATWVPFVWLRSLNAVPSQFDNNHRNAEKLYAKVRQKTQHLIEKVTLLEGHSSDYFNSLHETGLGTLISMKNCMSYVLDDLQRLHTSKKYDDLYELCKFILTPATKSYAKVSRLTSAKLELLEDWEQRSSEIVIACVIKLSIMSSKTENLGIQRAHKRRPTSHTLEELRKVLSEVRANH